MNGFEFLFSFYGLLLGLAVANVTSGFADTWRRRGNRKIGVAAPLLGLLVLLAAAQQWQSFWGARDVLTMGPWQLLTAMGMALPYIFVGQAMFPFDLNEGGSLEDHYFEQRQVLLGALLIPALVSTTYNIAMRPPPPRYLDYIVYFGLAQGPRVAILVALLIWRHRWVHWIGLMLLCMWMLVLLFV
jgi:hypothetical protein